jgi:hypothetical protein
MKLRFFGGLNGQAALQLHARIHAPAPCSGARNEQTAMTACARWTVVGKPNAQTAWQRFPCKGGCSAVAIVVVLALGWIHPTLSALTTCPTSGSKQVSQNAGCTCPTDSILKEVLNQYTVVLRSHPNHIPSKFLRPPNSRPQRCPSTPVSPQSNLQFAR